MWDPDQFITMQSLAQRAQDHVTAGNKERVKERTNIKEKRDRITVISVRLHTDKL